MAGHREQSGGAHGRPCETGDLSSSGPLAQLDPVSRDTAGVLVLVAVLCLAVPGAGTVVAEDPDTDAQFYRHVTAGASGVAQFGGLDETMAIVSL